jgi:PPOX class probable F420-dependent enzyme
MDPALDRARYVSLETFKKDGSGVKTAVWVATLGDKLLVGTDESTYKVKRVRNTPRVRVAVCNASGKEILGPWHEGTARVLTGADTGPGDAALDAKYGWQRRGLRFFSRLFGRMRNMVVIEITLGA